MPAWDPFALALLEGGLKPMPLAQIEAVKATLRERPEAVGAARAALSDRYGEPRADLDDEGRADLARAGSRAWGQLDGELKTEIKRIAKLLGAEEDPGELAGLAEEFGRLLGGALLGVEEVAEAVCGTARVVPPTPPEPGEPAYAATLLDMKSAQPGPVSSRRAAPAGVAGDAPLVTVRGLALSCLGLGLLSCLFTAAGAFGYRALGLGDAPAPEAALGSPSYTIVELTPRDGLSTRERALDVAGRIEPAGPSLVRVQGIRRRVGKDGRFSLSRLGLEEGLNRIAVVVERPDGTELARADLSVSVDSLPTLEVMGPGSGSVVFGEQTELTLRLRDASAQVELRVDDAVVPTQPGLIKHTVKLPTVGSHRLRLSAVDSAGNTSPVVSLLLVRAPPVPAWFTALPPARRPPLPLPAGLSFGKTSGEYLNHIDGSILVWVPAGRFPYGSLRGQPDERPVRPTDVADGFFLGKLEVTWAQYLKFCAATQRKRPQRRIVYRGESYVPKDEHPVVYVTWSDAVAYCKWAKLRLPSEVEWEYTAKGTEQRQWPWGDAQPRNGRCNLGSGRFGDMRHAGDGFSYTAPVGSFPKGASPFGCLDMAGNAMEWVADWYTGPGVEKNRWKVIRGGSWRHGAKDCRVSNRSYHDHDKSPIDQCGFRVARSAK